MVINFLENEIGVQFFKIFMSFFFYIIILIFLDRKTTFKNGKKIGFGARQICIALKSSFITYWF